MATQIRNFRKELFCTVNEAHPGRRHDSRFQSWAKQVVGIDPSQHNGYSLLGEFVPSGTTEVEIKPSVYVVKTTNGTRRYQTDHYSVVVMDASGQLSCADLYTSSDEGRGWALRLREGLQALLNELAGAEALPLADRTDDELIAALEARGYTVSKA
jgi:hypothetical protein